MRFKMRSYRLWILLFAVLTVVLPGMQAEGRVFFVTDTNDTPKTTSLRGAIMAANRAVGRNNLILLCNRPWPHGNAQPGRTYQLTIPGADEDQARTGDLDITRGNLTIVGVGSNVVIDASGLGDRVFDVFPKARLTLRNLAITGGSAPRGAQFSDYGSDVEIHDSGEVMIAPVPLRDGASGGGIHNAGKLTMQNCVVAGNSSGDGGMEFSFILVGGDGGTGGGIFNSGTAILDHCVLTRNSTGGGLSLYVYGGIGGKGGGGGAIYNSGRMNLSFCTVNDNSSGKGGGDGGSLPRRGFDGRAGGDGAGIFNVGTLRLNTCTVSGNQCGSGGTGSMGTAANAGSGGPGGRGGGVYNAGSLVLSSCTIVLNATGAGGIGGTSVFSPLPAIAGAGGNGGNGGGILIEGANQVVMRNSLIARNSVNVGGQGAAERGDPGSGPDLSGAFLSHRFNLLGAVDGSTGVTNAFNADLAGSRVSPLDPLIGELELNGGSTPTHALLPGSPAVDQGNCFGTHRDQRGHRRPFVYPSLPNPAGGDHSDIGAFESAP